MDAAFLAQIIEELPHPMFVKDRAFRYVLLNAIEAMPNGGTLTINAAVRGDSVVVAIADTGGGVPSEVRARLFEPLITTKPGGLGLGLVTARTLIEGQGGKIACVTSDERGACFEVTVPSG